MLARVFAIACSPGLTGNPQNPIWVVVVGASPPFRMVGVGGWVGPNPPIFHFSRNTDIPVNVFLPQGGSALKDYLFMRDFSLVLCVCLEGFDLAK